MERMILAALGGIASGSLIGFGVGLVRWKQSLKTYTLKAKESIAASHPNQKNQSEDNSQFRTQEQLKDIWTIHNKRYSMNSFVASHPGGSSAILLGKGGNCTELFEAYHSLSSKSRVMQILSKHAAGLPDAVVGDYDYDDTFNWKSTPFTDTLNRRVKSYFTDNKMSHKVSTSKVVYLLFFTLLTLVCIVGFFEGSWVAMLTLPFAYWLGPSTMMHDGSHFTLSFRPWVNKFCAYLGSAHMSLSTWNQQHVIGHHNHTNMDGKDPDLYHFTFLTRYNLFGFRVSHLQRSESMHKYWLKGVIVRSMLTTFGPSLIWDPLQFVVNDGKFLGIVKGPPVTWSSFRVLVHYLGRFIVVAICFLQPLLRLNIRLNEGFTTKSPSSFHSWVYNRWTTHGSSPSLLESDHNLQSMNYTHMSYEVFQTIAFMFGPYAIHGIIFYVFSQVSHVQPSCAHSPPKKGKNAIIISEKKDKNEEEEEEENEEEEEEKEVKVTSDEWTVHQVKSAVDWGVDSVPWLYLSNGLSHQIVHHLFPQVDWCHYIAVGRIVERTCEEFGIVYTKYPSLWSALRSHLSLISDLNYRPKSSQQGNYKERTKLPSFPPVVVSPDAPLGQGLEVTESNVEALAFLGQLNSFK